ncbi:hypothetical protein DFS34DRAFT_141617 [Phlyctochytrium arcticum]|nr:hypothetical protein DFS34DRAFT_141617 [Phlyctochytrium arcticum]
MSTFHKWTLVFCWFSVLHLSLWPIQVAATDKIFDLTIIHMSGTNPNYTTYPVNGTNRNFGGYAALKTAVGNLKAALPANSHNITLHGTNALGFSIFSQFYQGAKERRYLDDIGVQYITVGTRDLFYGPGAYSDKFLANTTFGKNCIGSNVLVSKSINLADYIVPYRTLLFDDAGVTTKVIIVSYQSLDMCTRTQCFTTAGGGNQIRLEEPLAATKKLMENLLFSEEPDIVIAFSGNNEIALDRKIAATIPGIDIIYTEDTLDNSIYPMVVNGPTGNKVLIINDLTALSGYRGVGRLNVRFINGTVSTYSGGVDTVMTCQGDASPLPNCVPPNPTMSAQLEVDLAPVLTALGDVSGSTISELDATQVPTPMICRYKECSAGSALADSILWKMGDACDAAFTNGGGIRKSLPAGNLTSLDYMAALPNRNTIATLSIAGADIIDAMNNGLSYVNKSINTGRFPQVGGLQVQWNPSNPDNFRVTAINILRKVGNTPVYVPLDPNSIYKLCVTDYLRGGGDGYSMFKTKALAAFDAGPQLDVVLKEYITANSPLPLPSVGRIVESRDPPLTGLCSYVLESSSSNSSGTLTDICAPGYRHRTEAEWHLVPSLGGSSPTPRSIYLDFTGSSESALNNSTDFLIIKDMQDRTIYNKSAIPKTYNVANTQAVTIHLTGQSPHSGQGLAFKYTSDAWCPGGYYLGSDACVTCSAGYFSSKGDLQCTICPVGTVAADISSEDCQPCPDGYFADTEGQNRCMQCDGGRLRKSASVCQCDVNFAWNGATCNPAANNSGPDMKIIIGVVVGVISVAAGGAYYVHRYETILKKR